MPPTDHAALIAEARSWAVGAPGDSLLNRLADALEEAGKDAERLDYLIEWLGMNDTLELSGIRDWSDAGDARAAIDAARGSDGAE